MSNEFLEKIKNAGVVGAGGAGFPTHIKLSSKAEYIVVNAAECEPLIRVDQELLQYYTSEFLDGLSEIIKETGAKKGFIAIKEKHAEVISHLTQKLQNHKEIELFLLKDFYPAGDEQVTVYEVLKRLVPRGGIPLNVGSIVCNVETILNVSKAMNGQSVTTTFTTITGTVKKPGTYELPIGMTYREALDLCGVNELQGKVAIDGGPMMGKIVTDWNSPVTKTTKAIILLDEDCVLIQEKTKSIEKVLKKSRIACIQCQKCTDLCPRDLLGHNVKPHIIMRVANYGLKDFSGLITALGCSECGACELYACPNGLSPRRINAMIKQELAKAGVKIEPGTNHDQVSPMIDYRKIPVKRLISRIGLEKFDQPAPLVETEINLKKAIIPLKQHIGANAVPIVETNTIVEQGSCIAEILDGKLGANVHASITGVVTEITSDYITIEAN